MIDDLEAENLLPYDGNRAEYHAAPTNHERSTRALKAIEAYDGTRKDQNAINDPDTFADMISDVLHLAHSQEFDLSDIVERGIANFRAETNTGERTVAHFQCRQCSAKFFALPVKATCPNCSRRVLTVLPMPPSREIAIYRAQFTGRAVGAIGAMEKIDTITAGKNEAEARKNLYAHHEHISDLSLSLIE